MSSRSRFLADGILIFFLWGVAVAQPLYDVLSRGAELFVVRRSQPADVLAMVAILSVLLPGCLLATSSLVDLLHRQARKVFYAVAVSVLLSAVFLQISNHLDYLPGPAALLAASVAGAACGSAFAGWRLLRERYVLIPASLMAISFPLWFLFATPIYKIVTHEPSAAARSRATQELATPVILMILDELPTATLMNEKREIDGGLFPMFRALAATSTWYRNATTVADFTQYAVPAILTGRYPDRKLLPTSQDYPDNLFTLLGPQNEQVVSERSTRLCPERLCGSAVATSLAERLGSLLSYLTVVYGHITLPRGFADNNLPAVSSAWLDAATPAVGKDDPPETKGEETAGRVSIFRSFILSIPLANRPALYFLHAGLPHHPWQYTPSGKRYEFRRAAHLRDFSNKQWETDVWLSAQGLQRHVMQTMFVDKLLGEMIDRLKEADLYDSSLVILTSDHGVSFRPGESRRRLTAMNYRDVMPVPLFVKLPHQKNGYVDDSNVETVDILPTIAAVQGIEVPWHMDGRPLVGRFPDDRHHKTVFTSTGERLSFNASFDQQNDALKRKLEVMGSGDPMRLYGMSPYGPYATLIGLPATAELGARARLRCLLDFPGLFAAIEPESSVTPSQITGQIHSEDDVAHHYLAVAVNGVVRAVTRTYQEAAVRRFSALVPEESFRSGSNNVEIFAIRDAPNGLPKLSRVPMIEAAFSLERAAGQPSEVIRSAEGATFLVMSGKLEGRVNRGITRKGIILFRGWARDVAEDAPPAAILVFENEEYRFSGTAGPSHRPPERGSTRAGFGFELAIPQAVFSDIGSAEIRVFALSTGGYASELRYSRNFQWRKRELPGG